MRIHLTTVFVDDQPRNVEAAAALGFRGVRFVDADGLRAEPRARVRQL